MSGMSIISIDLFKESFWEVRVVVILGLIEETVKFVFFEELFFFLVRVVLGCVVEFFGVSEEVWLFLGV